MFQNWLLSIFCGILCFSSFCAGKVSASEEVDYQGFLGECENYKFNLTIANESCPQHFVVFSSRSIDSQEELNYYNLTSDEISEFCLYPGQHVVFGFANFSDAPFSTQGLSSLSHSLFGKPMRSAKQFLHEMKKPSNHKIMNTRSEHTPPVQCPDLSCGSLELLNATDDSLLSEHNLLPFFISSVDVIMLTLTIGELQCSSVGQKVVTTTVEYGLVDDSCIHSGVWGVLDEFTTEFVGIGIGDGQLQTCLSGSIEQAHAVCFFSYNTTNVTAVSTTMFGNEERVVLDFSESIEFGEHCVALDPISENECNLQNLQWIKFGLHNVPYESYEDITWTLLRVEQDQELVSLDLTGNGRSGCAFCGQCASYILNIQNCKGEGLNGGNFIVEINGIFLNVTEGNEDFSYAKQYAFSVDCTMAPTQAPTPECPSNHRQIEAVLDTDDNADETILTLVDMDLGTVLVVDRGGFTYCIDNFRNYSLNVLDSGGDGVCCSSGFGNFALLDGTSLVDTAGNFGYYHGYFFEGFGISSSQVLSFGGMSHNRSPFDDIVAIKRHPTQITGESQSFNISVLYQSSQDRVISVEAIGPSPDFESFGSGIAHVSSDEHCVVLTIDISKPMDVDLISLHAAVVPEQAYSANPASSLQFATARFTVAVSIGDSFEAPYSIPLTLSSC